MIPRINPSCRIDPLPLPAENGVSFSVLRLDRLHPIVSGNKWFKLKFYLAEAVASQKTIVTFGGAYSNHIVATAAAAKEAGLLCIGIIRGEEAPHLSATLLQAKSLGMELVFVSRQLYAQKIIPMEISSRQQELYVIPEGGYGNLGMRGASEILQQNQTGSFTHLLSAVGTGTTLAGLAAAAKVNQQVIGISVLKNNYSLQAEIAQLLPEDKKNAFTLLHDYHFGGYAKRSTELLQFMNDFYEMTSVPTDFVYTGKAFFAALDLAKKNFFPTGSNVLLLHSGGLQGNRSLPKGTLIFD
ncbi:MAG: pyridoxal-phosphate dependent enzyme [Chitinophagaceae bacterium]|nr:MAG: pyridoxal-phosphate dependent enzyme [Chitinophagaceae bacterium]